MLSSMNACSLDPKLTDATARELLQQCLLQGPLSQNLPAPRTFSKLIDDCVVDLCCTSIQGPHDLMVILEPTASADVYMHAHNCMRAATVDDTVQLACSLLLQHQRDITM